MSPSLRAAGVATPDQPHTEIHYTQSTTPGEIYAILDESLPPVGSPEWRAACAEMWAEEAAEVGRERCRTYRRRIIEQRNEAYGNECEQCGAVGVEFQIDHIHGGGNAHRIALFGFNAGWEFARYLRNHGWPRRIDGHDLQLLCVTCHRAKSGREASARAARRRAEVSP